MVNSISLEADIFVQSTVNRASKVLSENLSKEEKIEEMNEKMVEILEKGNLHQVDLMAANEIIRGNRVTIRNVCLKNVSLSLLEHLGSFSVVVVP